MIRTVEAIIDETGRVLLLEGVRLSEPRRALVTILDEAPGDTNETALLSEAALSDWSRPEEMDWDSRGASAPTFRHTPESLDRRHSGRRPAPGEEAGCIPESSRQGSRTGFERVPE